MCDLKKISYLKDMAKELRKTAITMIHAAQSGHPGGSLSAADIISALYFSELNVKPEDPKYKDRDRFVLSKGHTCPILYSALIMRNFMPQTEINNLRKYGSILQGHPDMKRTPGIDISTGSLGQGISCAVGMAIGLQRDKSPARVFTLLGDGECDEGMVWEATECAVKYNLDNLVIVVDNNGIQNDGFCNDIMPLQNLAEKFTSFGCSVQSINGHVMEEIVSAFDAVRSVKDGKVKVIVASTIKGKGVSFMENDPKWHGLAPNDKEFAQAIREIEGGLR